MVSEEKERVEGQAKVLGADGLAAKAEQLQKAIAQNEVCVPQMWCTSHDLHVPGASSQ